VKHVKRIVQFSTCEVYGRTVAGVLGKDPAGMAFPFNEDTSPLIMGPVKNHRWIYACAKQLLERVLHAYGLEDGLNYTIIRPSNFIGPRIDYLPSERSGNPRVFSHFINALLYGTPMRLVDGGSSFRAYTHIDDAVGGIVRVIDNPGGVCDREIFNLGTPENETTIRGLAELMKSIFDEEFRKPGDPDPEIVDVPAEEFYGPGYEDCDRRIPDVAKARSLLGWESRHDLRSVVYHTMKYFVDRHRAG
jgi:UDP-apiose/xylose synthase